MRRSGARRVAAGARLSRRGAPCWRRPRPLVGRGAAAATAGAMPALAWGPPQPRLPAEPQASANAPSRTRPACSPVPHGPVRTARSPTSVPGLQPLQHDCQQLPDDCCRASARGRRLRLRHALLRWLRLRPDLPHALPLLWRHHPDHVPAVHRERGLRRDQGGAGRAREKGLRLQHREPSATAGPGAVAGAETWAGARGSHGARKRPPAVLISQGSELAG
jgi:hypothetical protein